MVDSINSAHVPVRSELHDIGLRLGEGLVRDAETTVLEPFGWCIELPDPGLVEHGL